MSLLLEYIENNPKETKRLIGIDYEKQQLFTQAEFAKNKQKLRLKFRLNSKGAGCKPKLSLREQMLLTLVYLSQLHTFQYLGVQFELVSLLLIIFSLLVRYFYRVVAS